jgi:hypothetical protein
MDAIAFFYVFWKHKRQVEATSVILMVNLFRSACSTTHPCSLACSHLGNISNEYY